MDSFKPAGIWRCFGCWVYDGLLMLALAFIGSWGFLRLFGDATHAPLRYFFQAYLIILWGLYFVYCWHIRGQTLAMKTWEIKLIDIRTKMPPTAMRSTMRYLFAWLSLLSGGLGFLWALWDKEHRFLHDRICKTVLRKAHTQSATL